MFLADARKPVGGVETVNLAANMLLGAREVVRRVEVVGDAGVVLRRTDEPVGLVKVGN